GRVNLQPAVLAEGQVVLADLVVLRQIGIVVIFAVPLGERGDAAVERDGGLEGEVEGPPVHHRQHTGHADADGAGGAVGGQAELRWGARRGVGGGQQTGGGLQGGGGGDGGALQGVSRLGARGGQTPASIAVLLLAATRQGGALRCRVAAKRRGRVSPTQ